MQVWLLISPLNVNLKALEEPNGALQVWAAQGHICHSCLFCYCGLKKKKINLLVIQLLNLFLLNKQFVRPKGEAYRNFPRIEAREVHGGLLQCWIFPKDFWWRC